MSEKSSNQASGGIGIAGILTVIFVTAKVFGFQPVASWSWWWVFCPLWISVTIVLVVLTLLFFIFLVMDS